MFQTIILYLYCVVNFTSVEDSRIIFTVNIRTGSMENNISFDLIGCLMSPFHTLKVIPGLYWTVMQNCDC